MAKDSTADSKVGGVQKTRRFYLVSKYCSKVRIHMYANLDFHCGNRATRLTTPLRRSSLNKRTLATIVYIGNDPPRTLSSEATIPSCVYSSITPSH